MKYQQVNLWKSSKLAVAEHWSLWYLQKLSVCTNTFDSRLQVWSAIMNRFFEWGISLWVVKIRNAISPREKINIVKSLYDYVGHRSSSDSCGPLRKMSIFESQVWIPLPWKCCQLLWQWPAKQGLISFGFMSLKMQTVSNLLRNWAILGPVSLGIAGTSPICRLLCPAQLSLTETNASK